MAKYQSIDEVNLECKALKQACDSAYEKVFDSIPRPEFGKVFWGGKNRNAVSTKGTLIGESECESCGKKVEIIVRLDPIEAIDENGNDVKLFNVLGGMETIKLSGHQCKERQG